MRVKERGMKKFPPLTPLSCTLSPRNRRRILDGQDDGLFIHGYFARGRLEGCDIARNRGVGIRIGEGAGPIVSSSKCVVPAPLPPSLFSTAVGRVGAFRVILACGSLWRVSPEGHPRCTPQRNTLRVPLKVATDGSPCCPRGHASQTIIAS